LLPRGCQKAACMRRGKIGVPDDRILQELADTRQSLAGEFADTRQRLGSEIADTRQSPAREIASQIAGARQSLAHEITRARQALEGESMWSKRSSIHSGRRLSQTSTS